MTFFLFKINTDNYFEEIVQIRSTPNLLFKVEENLRFMKQLILNHKKFF